ncbi:MAG: hypothetical protein MI724_07875 [Spirochaetales bacterium]|nr:hypothetical protein [Spirochaetales bacterium]
MSAFFESLQSILSAMGPTVMLPVVVLLFALILGAKPGKAFRAGVTIGVAFVGINLVIGVMWTALSEVSQLIVAKTGVQLDAVDVGWPIAAAISFGSSVGTFIIPVAIITNIVMLVTRATRTLNIDIWNFWHFAFVGTMLVVITGNIWIGILGSVAATAIALFLADFTAKAVQEQFELPGVAITTASAHSFLLPAIPINWLLNKIPGVKDWWLDPVTIKKRFGVLGEPVILGLVLGTILGAIAYLPPTEGVTWTEAIIKLLSSAVNLAAVLLLMPRMVAILMEGLTTVAEAARECMSKRFQGRELHLGLDAAVLIGHPSTLAASLLLIPITILLAVVLPGNRMMPFADFAALPFFVSLLVPITRGNVVRMLILGTFGAIAGLYMATWMAPIQTEAAVQVASQVVPEGGGLIANMGDGWVTTAWALFVPAETWGPVAGVAWTLIFIAVVWILGFMFNRNPGKWSVLAGTVPSSSDEETRR